MRLLTLSLLSLAATANAQLNRGFELESLTGWSNFDGAAEHITVVEVSDFGMPPSQGDHFARLQAGSLSQTEAETHLSLPPGTLADLYTDLGGTADPFGGDYSILSIDLPRGNYRFDFMFQSTESDHDAYLDHAFVVNAGAQLTELADGLSGNILNWTEKTISHPGGSFFFVCANGGDGGVDARLFIDDTFLFDTDNGSFETGWLHEWAAFDAGAGNVSVNGGGGVIVPTHGLYLGQVIAGALSQADAEAVLNLKLGTLAQLYQDLGGTGNPTGGDYAILAQEFGGTTVEFDMAFASWDFDDAQWLDHAFVVDSEGNITVLESTLTMSEVPSWERVSVPHPGGTFFIVCANGGDTQGDASLFIDDVREGPAAADAAEHWAGNYWVGAFGDEWIPTFGQVWVADQRALLESVKFMMYDWMGDVPFEFQVFVYEWDGDGPAGPALFESDVITADGVDQGSESFIIQTPGVIVERDACYVVLMTTLTTPTIGGGMFGAVGDRIPGRRVYSEAQSFNAMLNGEWTMEPDDWDLAIEFEYAPLESQVVPNVNQFDGAPSMNAFPWGSGGDFRYQQLYNAAQFNGRGGEIDSFAYRVQTIGAAFSPVEIDVQIYMGYSYLNPGQLDARFDDNWQFGKTLVHDGPVKLSSKGEGGFDVVVDIETNFQYDPEVGNLLIEVVMPLDGQPDVPALDSAGLGFAKGGTLWTDRLIATSHDAVTGILLGDDGHVTRFNFISEPPAYDPDCYDDDVFNIFDFVCFQGLYQTRRPRRRLQRRRCPQHPRLRLLPAGLPRGVQLGRDLMTQWDQATPPWLRLIRFA